MSNMHAVNSDVDKTTKAPFFKSSPKTTLNIILLIIICAVLSVAKPIVIPLIFAFVLSYLVAPLLTFLKTKLKIPAPLSVLLIVLLLLLGTYLFGAFMYHRVQTFVEESPKYHSRFIAISKSIASRWDLDTSSLSEINWAKEVPPRVMKITGSFVGFMSKVVMVIFFMVFMLLDQGGFERRLGKALEKPEAGRISGTIKDITGRIGRYLKIKMWISIVTGLLVWLLLRFLNIDFAATWGMLTFLLNFIPNIGSILAGIPPIFIALVQYHPAYMPVIGAATGLLTIQLIMGNIVEPGLLGDELDLSPVVILFSLVFWGWLWGIPGMLLSVPITSSIKIVCENVDSLQPVAVFMSGHSGKKWKQTIRNFFDKFCLRERK